MKHLNSFMKGAMLPLKATQIFMRNKSYWNYITWPILINLVIYTVGFLVFWNFLLPMVDEYKCDPNPEVWYSWAIGFYNWILGASITLAMVALSALTFVYILLIVEAPFLAVFSERLEKDLYGNHFNTSGWKNLLRSILLGIKNSAILAVITFFWTIVFFIGNFIVPGVSTIFGVLVIGYYYGISFLVYSAELRFLSYGKLRHLVKGNRSAVMGFGVTCYLIVLIPFVAVVFLPIAVIGATMLYNEYIESNKLLALASGSQTK